MNAEGKVTLGDQQAAYKRCVALDVEFVAKDFLRDAQCDCLCFSRCTVTDVDAACVEFDISVRTAIEQHRFFRKRDDRMRAVDRIFVTANL